LTALALNTIHPAATRQLMNDRPATDVLPGHHFLMWEEAGLLHAISPHQNLAYLDRSLLADLPVRFYHSVDSELDRVLPPGCRPYCAKSGDGLALMELSPANRAWRPSPWLDSAQYAPFVWGRMIGQGHLAIYQETVQFPIDASRRDARTLLSRERILAEIEDTRRRVLEGRPRIPVPAMLSALLALARAQAHPQATAVQPALREAALVIWRRGSAAGIPDPDPGQLDLLARLLNHLGCGREARQVSGLSKPIHAPPPSQET
jgi:hypothetical protein